MHKLAAAQNVVPARFRADKQLVSHDSHSNTYNYKYTFSVEIAPVCKVRVIVNAGVDICPRPEAD
jgi:NMD protein affecting ribosome stability and mRNA decay